MPSSQRVRERDRAPSGKVRARGPASAHCADDSPRDLSDAARAVAASAPYLFRAKTKRSLAARLSHVLARTGPSMRDPSRARRMEDGQRTVEQTVGTIAAVDRDEISVDGAPAPTPPGRRRARAADGRGARTAPPRSRPSRSTVSADTPSVAATSPGQRSARRGTIAVRFAPSTAAGGVHALRVVHRRRLDRRVHAPRWPTAQRENSRRCASKTR